MCNKNREENIKVTSDVNSWSNVVTRNMKQPDTEANKSTSENDAWMMVPEKSKNNASVKSWRQGLQMFGVKKNVTGLPLSQWLAGKGLQVLNCDLLTKYEGAQSLA